MVGVGQLSRAVVPQAPSSPLGLSRSLPPSDLLPPSAISLGFRQPADLRYWTIRFHVPWLPLWTVLAGVALEIGL